VLVANKARFSRKENLSKLVARIWREYYILVVFAVMLVISAQLTPTFFSWVNLLNVLKQSAVPGMIALAMLIVIIGGGIDLSVGSLMAAAGVLSVGWQRFMPLPVAIIAAIAVAGAGGLTNGVFIARRNMPPFVATLGMMAVARGLVYIYTHGGPIQITYPEKFGVLGRGEFGHLPVIVLSWLLVSAIVGVMLTRTTFGRTITSIGSNRAAVYLSGINVLRNTTATYVLSGLLCGLAGVYLSSRITVGTPLMGVGAELEAIAAVVIGGARLSGGRGTVWGTMIGVLILGLISNTLNLIGVNMYYQDVARGGVILLALMFRGGE
jgi:ribose/xylose/arabinose/galactoside ABC-type transport system permease subunit